MARFIKELQGSFVRLEIIGENKEEVIQWRDFFFNWGAIQIAHGLCDYTDNLNRQEKEIEELPDGAHLAFYAKKCALIKAFESSLMTQANWEQITARGGQRARKAYPQEIKRLALERFESIPTPAQDRDALQDGDVLLEQTTTI